MLKENLQMGSILQIEPIYNDHQVTQPTLALSNPGSYPHATNYAPTISLGSWLEKIKKKGNTDTNLIS